MRRWDWIAVAMLLASPGIAYGQDALFDAAGYRITRYRAPTRRPPEGVTRIAPAAAALLRPDVDALFLDVLPAEGGHRQADGRWRLAAPHESIEGARWFPEGGQGAIAPDAERRFIRAMARLTRGRREWPVVVFCRADCWLSWNAARRLHALGYRRVWWLAEGTDGWRDMGLPLVPVAPEGGLAL